MTESAEDGDMSLVMPFIVVTSNGGPYDDDAFTAGYECGLIDQALTVAAANATTTLERTVRTANLPQLDLIAMRHGFTVETQVDGYCPDWVLITFTGICECGPEASEDQSRDRR